MTTCWFCETRRARSSETVTERVYRYGYDPLNPQPGTSRTVEIPRCGPCARTHRDEQHPLAVAVAAPFVIAGAGAVIFQFVVGEYYEGNKLVWALWAVLVGLGAVAGSILGALPAALVDALVRRLQGKIHVQPLGATQDHPERLAALQQGWMDWETSGARARIEASL